MKKEEEMRGVVLRQDDSESSFLADYDENFIPHEYIGRALFAVERRVQRCERARCARERERSRGESKTGH